MKKYEYQTKTIDSTKFAFTGDILDLSDFEQTLNNMGSEGWELMEMVSANSESGKTRDVVCVFKREITSLGEHAS